MADFHLCKRGVGKISGGPNSRLVSTSYNGTLKDLGCRKASRNSYPQWSSRKYLVQAAPLIELWQGLGIWVKAFHTK